MTIPFTEAQLKAIKTYDRSLLVSAAAGSGKTAVLAERCAYLVCDAQPPTDVDRLLVVTFTNAAAEEMKKRIGDALIERAAKHDDARLRRQVLLMNSASISTLHSLGSAIIRRHFNVLGIDPNFRLLDNDEARLLRTDLADGLLEARFDDTAAEDFRKLVDRYGGGQPSVVRDLVLSLHGKLSSLVDPQTWLATRRLRLIEAIERPLAESQMGQAVVGLLRDRVVSLGSAAARLSKALQSVSAVAPYVAHVDSITQLLRDWYKLLVSRPFDTFAPLISQYTLDRLPTVKASEEKNRAQAQINALKGQIKAFVDNGLFSTTEAKLREGLGQTLWVVDQMTSLVHEFDAAYRDAKQRVGTLDFSDLERFTLQLLQEPGSKPPAPSWIAKTYQNQFQHVLVDEYQDINELQDTVLALLSRPDNLFTVGDVKQSIYRFRQADPTRFINRRKEYESIVPAPGEVIDLQQNFRSRGPLLEVLNGVFGALMTEESAEVPYDETHRLIPGATYAVAGELFPGSPIELHVIEKPAAGQTSDFESDEREAIVAAHQIRRLLGYDGQPAKKVTERNGTTRDVEPRDIVILLRALRVKAERFAAVLRRAGVPVQADSTTGFFDATEIRDMISVLKLIANGRDDVALAAYLRSPLVGWANAEDRLAEIRIAFSSGDGTPCFHQAFARYAAEKTDALSQDLRGVRAALQRWRDLSERRAVADVVWTILQETSYLAYISGLPDGEQRVANVLHFHARARQFEGFSRPTAARFLHFLHNLEEQSDSGMPPVAGATANAVRIMSVHKSKGLEFPIVILPDLGKSHNLRDADTKLLLDDSVGLAARVVDADKEVHYPSLATVLANHHIRKKSIAEELRVLYVAGTRAKEHLILIGTDVAGTAEQWDAAWTTHRGPIPAADVLAGQSMLDWVGPASAMIENQSPGSFLLTEHPADEVDKLGTKILGQRDRNEALAHLALRRPLDPPPGASEIVQAAVERLDYVYPHQALTGIRAAASVTSLTKSGRSARGGASETSRDVVSFERVLALPRFITEDQPLTPAEAGTITHTVLQHLDLARSCDGEDLRAQVQQLIDRRFIRAQDAAKVSYDAILWLMNTPLAKMLCQHRATLLRELELVYPQAPEGLASESADLIMVRGRIDAVVVEPDGLTLVDYKTDRVTAATIDARAAFYGPQIKAYRDHLVKVVRRPVKASYLVFLTPRLVRGVY